jgi:hypothetical protein
MFGAKTNNKQRRQRGGGSNGGGENLDIQCPLIQASRSFLKNAMILCS